MADDRAILLRPGLTEEAIAEVLRRGPSQDFLNAIAAMLDPLPIEWKTPEQLGEQRPRFKTTGYRLQLKNSKDHRPRGTTKADMMALGEEMLALDTLSRGDAKRAKAQLVEVYGVSTRTAEAAKRLAREMNDLWRWMEEKAAADK